VAALRAAAFLDRDGTLNRPAPAGEYIETPEQLVLLPGAAEAVELLHAHGYVCVVVSNQRGVALGRMSAAGLSAVDARLRATVAVDASYYCTHGLPAACPCRKPAPGLLVRAARDHGLDLARSWMVGDSDTDMQAGARAGCRSLRVAPEPGALLHAAQTIVANP
jgi:D-glycero-D-manno-heptose 1,7-bisphosphate phosphatase